MFYILSGKSKFIDCCLFFYKNQFSGGNFITSIRYILLLRTCLLKKQYWVTKPLYLIILIITLTNKKNYNINIHRKGPTENIFYQIPPVSPKSAPIDTLQSLTNVRVTCHGLLVDLCVIVSAMVRLDFARTPTTASRCVHGVRRPPAPAQPPPLSLALLSLH